MNCLADINILFTNNDTFGPEMDDTGPGPVPISASKRSIFFWFSSIDLICLLRTRGSWWGESCGKIPSHKWTKTDVSIHKTYRHCHLFDSEAHGVADLGQGVHAALVRPRVPGLRRADHQRPVVRSDSRPESICIVMSIADSEIVFGKKMLNIWVFFFLWRLSFPDSISREGQQLKKSICNRRRCRINFLWLGHKAVKISSPPRNPT